MNEDFKKRLKAARNAKGLTQWQVADLIGVKQQTYATYETRSRGTFPPAETLIKLSVALDVSIDYLLGLPEMDTEVKASLITSNARQFMEDSSISPAEKEKLYITLARVYLDYREREIGKG